MEDFTEWHLGPIQIVNGYGYQVQMQNDTIRNCVRRPRCDYSTLWFTDCTHPLQNAICSPDYVKAWRLVPRVEATNDIAQITSHL